MHDHPAARWATDALWSALAEALRERDVEVPAALDRREDYAEAWTEPALVLSQTCGYPYVTRLRGRVQLVMTPVYRAAGCDGAWYCSTLLVRADASAHELADLRGRPVAYNATDSQSGYNSLRAAVAPLARNGRFFSATVATGSHGASTAAVASGAADLCAIDCVTWALMGRYEPERTAGLRVIGHTATVPGLPLITSLQVPLDAARAAVASAMARPDLADAREALLLERVEFLANSDYDAILDMERQAIGQGYPTLA
jgi:ABC-type phosphate/phosphonate transport system substrate-binding protein